MTSLDRVYNITLHEHYLYDVYRCIIPITPWVYRPFGVNVSLYHITPHVYYLYNTNLRRNDHSEGVNLWSWGSGRVSKIIFLMYIEDERMFKTKNQKRLPSLEFFFLSLGVRGKKHRDVRKTAHIQTVTDQFSYHRQRSTYHCIPTDICVGKISIYTLTRESPIDPSLTSTVKSTDCLVNLSSNKRNTLYFFHSSSSYTFT